MTHGRDLVRPKRWKWDEHCTADAPVSGSGATLQPHRFHLTRRARRFCATAVSFFVASRKACALELLALAQNRLRQTPSMGHNSL